MKSVEYCRNHLNDRLELNISIEKGIIEETSNRKKHKENKNE